MILTLYKSNSALVLFALPFIMLGLWIPSFLSSDIIIPESDHQLFTFLQIQNPLLNRLIAFGAILLTGIVLNVQVNKNEIFERNTYVTALLYVLIMSSVKDLHQMHPLIFANLFWVLGYRRLLNVYNQVQCKSEIFDATFFFMLATLLFFPAAGSLLLLPWMALIIIRPFDYREYMMPLFAILLFSIYVGTAEFIHDDVHLYFQLKSWYTSFEIQENWSLYLLYFLVIILMYFSGFHLIKKSNTSTVRFRKLTSLLISLMSLTMLAMLFEKFISNNDSFILIGAVPLSILFSFYFFYANRTWLSRIIFYTTFAILIANIYFEKFLFF